jgi:hypothetical protein
VLCAELIEEAAVANVMQSDVIIVLLRDNDETIKLLSLAIGPFNTLDFASYFLF